ncbi:hypothetical protein EI94DRAFT_161897 [Lactarius quietus]|nr:hypothetical protein EI94DRAFT_161897 [Lactarius quietus]
MVDKVTATGGVWATGKPARTPPHTRNGPATPRATWLGAITARGFPLISARSMVKAVTADCTKQRANSRTDSASIADAVSEIGSGAKFMGKPIRPRVPQLTSFGVIAVPLGPRPPSPEMERSSRRDSWALNFSESTMLRTAKLRVGSVTARYLVETNERVFVPLRHNRCGYPGDTVMEQRTPTLHPRVEVVTVRRRDKQSRFPVLPEGVLPSRDHRLGRRHIPLLVLFAHLFPSR